MDKRILPENLDSEGVTASSCLCTLNSLASVVKASAEARAKEAVTFILLSLACGWKWWQAGERRAEGCRVRRCGIVIECAEGRCRFLSDLLRGKGGATTRLPDAVYSSIICWRDPPSQLFRHVGPHRRQGIISRLTSKPNGAYEARYTYSLFPSLYDNSSALTGGRVNRRKGEQA